MAFVLWVQVAQARDLDVERRVRLMGDGKIGAARFAALVWLIRHTEARLLQQQIGCVQLAQQIAQVFVVTVDTDFLADFVPICIGERGEAR